MAMPMSSAFTGAERRKKLVTYGRAGRLSSTHIFTEDAPSPERPHKHAGRLPSASQRPGLTPSNASALDTPHTRRQKSPVPRDDFHVPSDHEPTPRAAPTKKSLPKPAPKPADDFDIFDVPDSGDEWTVAKHGKEKAAPLPRNLNITRHKLPTAPAVPDKKQRVPASSNVITTTAPVTRTRAQPPLAGLKPSLNVRTKPAQGSAPAANAPAKPTAHTRQTIVSRKKVKTALAPAAEKTAPTPPTEPTSELDVFDVPSSDEDAPTYIPARSLKAPLSRAKVQSNAPTSRTPPSPEPSAESDASHTSHARKRRASMSSSATAKATDGAQKKREASVSQRSRKHQKTEKRASPGQAPDESTQSTLVAVNQDLPINKPKRTRTRTVPVISRPAIVKAQSSPGTLHHMLATRSAMKPSPVQEKSEIPVAEDETMYDIQDDATPLARGTKFTTPGTVTPRQRDIFSNLLDGSDLATPMPSVSRLRLTDRKRGPAMAALVRSSSDIPQSTHTRNGKLIDMLKRDAPSSDEESESEESEEGPTVSAERRPTISRAIAPEKVTETMDVDPDIQTSSQSSRAAVAILDGPRLTYARKERSYLEEPNIEDGLLNWGEDIEVDMADGQCSVTGSESDAQQVTGLPELRRKGQLYKFEAETQAMIEDISGKSNMNMSARRSAIMEFASQTADRGYVEQLLESAMMSSLLRAISTTGDMIFDSAAAVAMLFVLRASPSYAVVEQIYHSDILSTLRKLLSSPLSSFDIHRISKDRKTNMAASARETVAEFRLLILKTCNWSSDDVPKLSPQLLAIKFLEELVIGLRTPGNTDAIVDEGMIGKILDVASGPSQRVKSGKATAQDRLILDTTFSALESLSVSKEGQATWPNEILRRLADMMPAFFETSRASPVRLVIRLCMNLTNSKPEACQIFAGETFVTRLTRFIVECFKLLHGDTKEEQTEGVREDLILGLGAMINLAEFSDEARLNVLQGGDELMGELVRIFLEGSERADRADSVEESQSSVVIGYLSILLGNMCLNGRVRRKVTPLLPGENISMLVQKVREFVQYNQRLDRWTNEFEGVEGQQTLKNFTLRLMLVAERLEEVVV